METKSNRAGFTSLGFSKSGFGCCGHWETCSMGKYECHYDTIDPEVKNYCNCYKRNHNLKFENVMKSVEVKQKKLFISESEEETKKSDELEQLSLF